MLFLTQSHRDLEAAGHLVGAKRWHLQKALLWPHSRSQCGSLWEKTPKYYLQRYKAIHCACSTVCVLKKSNTYTIKIQKKTNLDNIYFSKIHTFVILQVKWNPLRTTDFIFTNTTLRAYWSFLHFLIWTILVAMVCLFLHDKSKFEVIFLLQAF